MAHITHIPHRVRALRYLRLIFLVYFIAALGSFLSTIIASAISGGDVPVGVGVTFTVFDTIFFLMKLVAIVLFAVTLVLTMEVNRECRLAFWVGMASAALSLAAGVMEFAMEDRMAGRVLSMVAVFGVAFSIFALIDGIYEQQARKSPLFAFACIAIGFTVVGAILEFLAFSFRFQDISGAWLFIAGEICYILGYGVIFGCLHRAQKEVKDVEESLEKEEKANEIA